MYTVAIRIYLDGYLVAKNYCRAIDAENWAFEWKQKHALAQRWFDYNVQINEIGKF